MGDQRQVTGTRVEGFPARRRVRWDFSEVADGHVYLLRKGRDFDIAVDSLAAAARRWAREYGYTLTTRSEFGEHGTDRRKVGLYVRFEQRKRGRRARPDAGST